MIKGAQKRMIVIKTADSKIFEEAYFVVKLNYEGEELDMLAEADRIAAGVIETKKSSRSKKPDKKSLIYGACCGLLGIFVGVIAVVLIKFPL